MRPTPILLVSVLAAYAATAGTVRAAEILAISSADRAEAMLAAEGYIYGKPPGAKSLKVYDDVLGSIQTLTFDKWHAEGSRVLSQDTFAVCGEFVSEDMRNYMVWFVVQKGGVDQWIVDSEVEEIPRPKKMYIKTLLIHKVDGEERIRWREDGGVWKIEPVESTQKEENPS